MDIVYTKRLKQKKRYNLIVHNFTHAYDDVWSQMYLFRYRIKIKSHRCNGLLQRSIVNLQQTLYHTKQIASTTKLRTHHERQEHAPTST
jgi:hypothetical protein